MGFKIQIGSLANEYELFQTKAPVNYDGFGTITVTDFKDDRWVLIRLEHKQWQISRYASGRYSADPVEGYDQDIEQKLYKRLLGPNPGPDV